VVKIGAGIVEGAVLAVALNEALRIEYRQARAASRLQGFVDVLQALG